MTNKHWELQHDHNQTLIECMELESERAFDRGTRQHRDMKINHELLEEVLGALLDLKAQASNYQQSLIYYGQDISQVLRTLKVDPSVRETFARASLAKEAEWWRSDNKQPPAKRDGACNEVEGDSEEVPAPTSDGYWWLGDDVVYVSNEATKYYRCGNSSRYELCYNPGGKWTKVTDRVSEGV